MTAHSNASHLAPPPSFFSGAGVGGCGRVGGFGGRGGGEPPPPPLPPWGGGVAGALRARSPTNEYIDTAGLRGDRKSVIVLPPLQEVHELPRQSPSLKRT
jgi:hypothetical protein